MYRKLVPVEDNRAGYQRQGEEVVSITCECGATVNERFGEFHHVGPCKIIETRSERTIINNYVVELELYEDCGEQRSDCCVSTRSGRRSCSLQLLIDMGAIEDGIGEEIPVKQATIDKIEDWALKNGY